MFGKVHHVGIACADIEATAQFILSAIPIASDSGAVFDPLQRAHLRIFNVGTPLAIELVAGEVVESILSRGGSYYHLCYETPDIDRSIADLVELGGVCVSTPKPAVLFNGRRVAFVYSPIGLIEFLETA